MSYQKKGHFNIQMIEERFIELLTKKLADEIDEIELQELSFIVDNDEESRDQYIFFTQYWIHDEEHHSDSTLMFQQIKSKIGFSEEINTTEETDNDTMDDQYRLKSISFLWRIIAAVLIAGICFGMYYCYHRIPATQDIAALLATKTPSRSKLVITLSDGSKVELNSETVLKYPAEFTGPTREVYLSGEAFFNVTKDHKHPFIVHTGKMSIKVLGTAFNVKSYDNDIQSETTLIRGAIEVTLADRPSDRIILKPHDKLILKSNIFKKITYSAHKLIAANADSVNTNYALTNLTYLKSNDTTIVETSWVNNKLVFKDESFDVLANQMERWYGVKVKFENSDAKNYRFTGVFEKESVIQAFNALELIEPFNYKYKNETIYIY